ncbi:hypothetical protein EMGBS15_08160 [Filimonas sp.]|nr:hypothetical protein EMGBS15_08160 [Filimonas sp.]
MRKEIGMLFLLLFLQQEDSFSQHLYVKSNVLNWVFLRPSIGLEYTLDKHHSIGLHGSWGSTFWKKENDIPYYRFKTILIDYYQTVKASKNDRYQFRLMGYAGYIQRDIYKEEKLWESDWYVMRLKKGRNFSGEAIRLGVGISNVFRPGKRIAIEQNIGLGWGTYFSQTDTYYTPVKTNYTGFFDVRFAINFCYAVF